MSNPYRVRSDQTWAEARAAFEGGVTAEAACARFDLGLSNFKKRMAEEGWRRADLDDPESWPEDDIGEDLPDIDDQALAELAFRRMGIEARRGRLSAALNWGRLRDMALRQLAAGDREADRLDAAQTRRHGRESIERVNDGIRIAKGIEAQARAALAVARTDRPAAEVDEVDEVDDGLPLSRAERRRRAARERKRGPP